MRFDDLAFKVFVEKIRGAHGPETQRIVHARLAQTVETLAQVQQFLDIARLERGGIGRLAHQQRFDELALAHDIARIPLVGLGIALRVARDFAAQRIVVVIQRQMAAAAHHGAAALVGNDLQAVFRQFQRAHDLGAQQTADVGAIRIRKILIQAAAYRRAADVRLTLEHQDLEARTRQIAPGDQSIVAGADDDRVEVPRRLQRGGAQAGTLCLAPLDFKVASTAISNAFNVSDKHEASWAAETNQGSRESGSQSTRS